MRSQLAVISVSLVLALFVAAPARACSVCGCDPAAGTLGLDRPATSALRFGLEDRYLVKESGAGPSAEGERENRLNARAQLAPLERLVFQAEIPFFLWRRHLDAGGAQDDLATGFGDIAVGAWTELVRLGLEARHVLALTASLKLPTGANARHLPGLDPDEHLQLGSGSWDELLGLSYLFGPQPWTFYASAVGRNNGANGRGFRYGNALFATLGARRAIGEERRLLLSLEGQLRAAGMDRLSDGSRDADSGGRILYATAAAAWGLSSDLFVRAIVQVPAATSLNGVQHEHPVAYLALSRDFLP